MLSIANGGCASSSARGVVAARSVSEARRRGGKKTRRAAASLMSSFAKSNSTNAQTHKRTNAQTHKREEEDKNVFAKVAATTALAFTMITAPPPSFAAFDSKTSQSLADDAKEYRVELSGSSQGVTGSIKINSKLNRSLQETVTFDFSDVKGLAPNTKHGINIHDETTGKSWNPELRPHGAPDSVKKFGASACHFVGDGCVLNRHYGDLGNIAVDGEGKIANVKDIYVSLNEKKDNFIGGKEFVIRENKDDFTTEQDDGNAGSVIAKGSIVAIN